MDAKQLEELRKQSVKNITTALPKLSRDELASLLAHESEETNPRESLIEALAKAITARDSDDADAIGVQDDAPPAWQAIDYNGPITADQAQWRIANLPRHWEQESTKPAAGGETK